MYLSRVAQLLTQTKKTMKKLILPLAMLALISFKTADTTLSGEERKIVIDQLTQSKEHLLKSIKGLSANQLNFKADPTSWSIAECAEHIAISEGMIWGMVDGALKQPADPSRRGEVKMSDAQIVGMITDRTTKRKTQEMFEPSNKFGSHDGAVKEFETKRNSHMEYVKTTQDDLRNRYSTLAFGTIDTYQVILFLAGHSERHTKQIEEVMANANFPKK
jgi:DinB superfamily